MRNLLFFISGVIFCLFVFNETYSQNKDFQIWSGIALNKEITKKIQLGLEEQIRLSENATKIKQYYTAFSATYKLNKHLDIEGSYRFIQKNESSSFQTNHRLSFDIGLRKKIAPLTFSLRARYQKEFYPVYFYDENPLKPTQYLRNKLSIEAKTIKKLNVYLSSELFYQLDNPAGNIFDKLRNEIGMQYKINKKNFINLFFMLQKQINVSKANSDYILGVNYKIKI
jgi:hypothetical protein